MDFASDHSLLSHNQQLMQEKTNMVADKLAQVRLNIHKEKTKILKINSTSTKIVKFNGSPLQERQSFTYLGIIATESAEQKLPSYS